MKSFLTKVGWSHAKDINYAKHFWHFSGATWPPCMHFPISIFIFYFAIDFFDTWYGYSFNYQACILLYFLWFLDFFLILFKGNFVQIIKYFLRSILHWRFSRNSVRYSCNNITTTLIQTSRLFYFGSFSKTNHRMMI